MREQLKEIDINFDKRIALIEYLLFRYTKSINDFVSRPQGDNTKEIEKAQQLIEEVQTVLNEATKRNNEAREAEKLAKSRAQEAARTADEATRTADEATKAALAAAKAAEEAARTQQEATRTANEATERANEATAKAEDALKDENEQRSALAEVEALELARDNKTKELTAKSEDESIGIVARNRAKNELAQVSRVIFDK